MPPQRLAGYAQRIQPVPAALLLPRFDLEAPERFPFGARSDAGVFVGELLSAEVPQLADPDGDIEIVAIARRPGVLTKVAIRARGPVAPITLGIGADHLARVGQRLDGERIQVVRWQRSASGYIADALGLGEVPPMLLLPWLRHAQVLLGEIDLRGISGWRGLNAILASALTGWRIRLEPVASTPAWSRLHAAMRARRTVLATVVNRSDRGYRVELRGLYAALSNARGELSVGEEVDVRITRMDPDEGRIFVANRLAATAQLRLF